MPFILSVPCCTAFASMLASKLRVPPIFILTAATMFQIVGTVLLSTISVDIPTQTYVYEAILGVGIGLNFGSLIILTPNIVKGRDQCEPYFLFKGRSKKLKYSSSCGHGRFKSASSARRRHRPQHCIQYLEQSREGRAIRRSLTAAAESSPADFCGPQFFSCRSTDNHVERICRRLQSADEDHDGIRSGSGYRCGNHVGKEAKARSLRAYGSMRWHTSDAGTLL